MISAYGYQWKQRRFGGIFPEVYKQAKERENFTTQQWQEYQQEQLEKILLHAYNTVPFYKKAFDDVELNEAALRKITPLTLYRLPFLSKQQLRAFGTTTLLSSTKEKDGKFFASSGSTGTPTQILFSHAMHQRWIALFESRARNWAGVNSIIPRGMIGGRRILPDANTGAPFYRYNFFEKQVYFSAYHINATNAKNYAYAIEKYSLQYMTGYAMSNYFLARFFKEEKIAVPELKAVITSSEKLTPEMRELFKEVYNCKTFDGWSGVEACGLITECEHGSLHISPDAGLIEVLNDDMQPVQFGERGTVYCTGFINYDQPLIRYNIGDTIVLSDKKCSCGRNMPVVCEIIGRTEDVIIGKDGREMVRFHSVFNDLHSIKKAQVIQESLDDIIVKVVEENEDIQEYELIKKRMQSQLGDINITIIAVPEIPLNKNGKFQAVVSNMQRTRT
jgi:phenylacetate-CoA ligase